MSRAVKGFLSAALLVPTAAWAGVLLSFEAAPTSHLVEPEATCVVNTPLIFRGHLQYPSGLPVDEAPSDSVYNGWFYPFDAERRPVLLHPADNTLQVRFEDDFEGGEGWLFLPEHGAARVTFADSGDGQLTCEGVSPPPPLGLQTLTCLMLVGELSCPTALHPERGPAVATLRMVTRDDEPLVSRAVMLPTGKDKVDGSGQLWWQGLYPPSADWIELRDGLLWRYPEGVQARRSDSAVPTLDVIFDPRPQGGMGVVLDSEGDDILVGTVYRGTPAEAAGLKAGDRFLEVSRQIREQGLMVSEGMISAEALSLQTFPRAVTGPEGTDVTVVVQTGEEPPRTLTLTRAFIEAR